MSRSVWKFVLCDIWGSERSTKSRSFKNNDTCKFCNKLGHSISFCPSLPSEPPEEERCNFAEQLLSTKKLRLTRFSGLDFTQALDEVTQMGNLLNKDNPWVEDVRPFSALRKGLGFWKAIGADKSVLSWIAYGYQMRFAKPLPRKSFKNAPNTCGYEEFIDKEISTHVSDGSFVEVTQDQTWIVSPFLISVNSNGKPRR